ncbi:MAG TPA: aryl-sulfate sulfotransferase [Bacteroidota bacterium]|nr:aryl-sulfate sulfotransferase [Bacteroidota bacterium]
MKSLIVLTLLTALSAAAAGTNAGGFLFVSPVPGSSMVSARTNIIVRRSEPIGREALPELGGIAVIGSASGPHAAVPVIADDGRTALWTLPVPLAPGENVTVTLPSSFHGPSASAGAPYSWSFTVSGSGALPAGILPGMEWTGPGAASLRAEGARPLSRPGSVLSGFPVMTVDSVNDPAPGSIFLTTTNALPGVSFYAMILDNAGHPVDSIQTAPYSANDFKVQPNGLLSYARVTGVAGAVGIATTVHMVLDSTLAVVDSFQCGNGYTADFHEFLLLPNGHAILMAYDGETVDMSRVVPGGKPNALVYGSIVQELDASKNVVFQWRSWDYIPITDSYDDLTASAFDYIHVNSIDVDTDGNLLVSCRETAEILKIDRITGNVLWRWGGKHNQFTFIGEHASNAPNYFSYQHDVRRIAGGDITLLDNGNQHVPPYTRAAEYALDENARTATLVWEYRHTPDVFDPAAGSVQRLTNGNTLIGWATANFLGVGTVAVTEVHPDRSTAFEMSMPAGLFSYRAFRFPWKSRLPSAAFSLLDLHPGVSYLFNGGGQNTGVSIMLSAGDAVYSRVTVTRYPYAPLAPSLGENPPFLAPVRVVIAQAGFASYTGTVTFDSTYTSLFPSPSRTSVYFRGNEGSGAFAPMATTYDGPSKSFSVTTSQFGEYAFGWPAVTGAPSSPALIAPVSGAFVNQNGPVTVSWSSRGRALRYHVQVATDSAFMHLSANDSSVAPQYTIASPLHDTVYYWRTEAVGDSGLSGWSPPWRFITRAPFIGFTYPAGGETFDRDSSYVVRWQTNQAGLARLVLLSGTTPVTTIADSIQNTGAYLWKVGGALTLSGGYRLALRSIADTTVSTLSAGTFTIGTAVLSLSPLALTPRAFSLEQNYPNPFNPSTQIRYALPERAMVSLEVFNTLGQQVARLVDREQEAGFHEVRFDGTNLASGLYFYRLTAHPAAGDAANAPGAQRDFVQTRKLLLVR